jgi:hypothetical protein
MTDQQTEEKLGLRQELAAVLNRHSREGRSNTPDLILAQYLIDCLSAFDYATRARDQWYSVDLRPGRRTGHGL